MTEHRPSDRFNETYALRRPLPGLLTGSSLARARLVEIDQFWYSTLELYVRCDLSRLTQDKLRAIEGIASLAGERKRDVCALGHFSKILLRSLCWNATGDAVTSERDLPSWSWASRDGQMDQPLGRLERFDVNTVTHPIAALIHPEHAETLLEPRRSDTNLAFAGRLLRVRSVGDAYHPRVGTSAGVCTRGLTMKPTGIGCGFIKRPSISFPYSGGTTATTNYC